MNVLDFTESILHKGSLSTTKLVSIKKKSFEIYDYEDVEEAIADLSNPQMLPYFAAPTVQHTYVVARYPENHNSLLSRTIQKQLGNYMNGVILHHRLF